MLQSRQWLNGRCYQNSFRSTSVDEAWLDQLRQLREADRLNRQSEVEVEQQPQAEQRQASELLRQSRAHELLRQVQKTLLGGQGLLDIFERKGQYDRVLTLVWQGPISAARKPDPDDPAEYSYVLVGVRQGQLWVNGKPLASAEPKALQAALLEACQKPGRQK
jgi:hypothetical protein